MYKSLWSDNWTWYYFEQKPASWIDWAQSLQAAQFILLGDLGGLERALLLLVKVKCEKQKFI